MTYYHAQIVLKDKKADDLFEFDLTKEYAVSNVARPFISDQSFLFGGASVKPSSVERMRIVRTDKPADVVAKAAAQEYQRHRVMMGVNMAKERIVSQPENSVDVTREVFGEAQAVSHTPESTNKSAVAHGSTKTVFIVHGHDHELLRDLELVLRRWNLDPIILSQKPNRGMTLVEKVETNTEVAFAFVLLTPDDYGGTDIGRLQRRARQNVIWEWGYLVGKLGREHVCCLYKEGVEIPSDLHGIGRVEVKTNLNANLEEIRRELKAAGFDIP